jgi:hypothetical protein
MTPPRVWPQSWPTLWRARYLYLLVPPPHLSAHNFCLLERKYDDDEEEERDVGVLIGCVP